MRYINVLYLLTYLLVKFNGDRLRGRERADISYGRFPDHFPIYHYANVEKTC